MIPKKQNRGISLPLTIGLVVVLMIAAVTVHQIILLSLQSAQRIESADRAFFAAESGIENALYELSAHFAGYETPELSDPDARSHTFGTDPSLGWENKWKIDNLEASGDFSGRLHPKQKLIINLFEDISGSPVTPVEDKSISLEPADISLIDVSTDFQITFKIPFDAVSAYTVAFSSGLLTINNDNDDDLNEDGRENDAAPGTCDPVLALPDADCDGRDDEDGEEDPVIYWKITDDEGRTLVPVPGCFTGVGSGDDPTGSEICEKDFALGGSQIEFILDWLDTGVVRGCVSDCTDGDIITIGTFIDPTYDTRSAASKMSIEFLVVAPLIQDDGGTNVKEIPYLEYDLVSGAESGNGLPLPVFNISSDGWYRDFKQSILTQIYPKENVPLLDITVIQQQ